MTATAAHDLKLEEAVLGAVLLSDSAMPRLVIDLRLTPQAFYRPEHGQIWRGMLELSHAGEPVDTLTVRRWLVDHGMDRDRAASLVDALPAAPPSAGSVLSYAAKMIELAEWRAVGEAGLELTGAMQDLDVDRRRAAEALLTGAHRSRADTMGPDALADLLYDYLHGQTGKVWPTPFGKLNEALGGGLHAGEVTLLGGWTSHGKSILTDELLVSTATLHQAKVHLYINEMSLAARAMRLASSISGVDLSKIRQRSLNAEELDRTLKQIRLPFGITHVADWSAEEIARDIRFRAWDLCALDLVHRLPFNDERELAKISTVLNTAAQLSGAHLILVVHLNEARAIGAVLPAPVLRDIRGSGMLKNDADNVMFIHRTEEESGERTIRLNQGELALQKCRNGYLAGVPVELEPQHARFSEIRRRSDLYTD
ncbi:MAG: DnaB-like helicase C-terminal domain-containing protein [Solirubrobacteraceae bacterium]